MTMLILAYPISKIYLHNVYQLNQMTDTLDSFSFHYAILLDCPDGNGVEADTQTSKLIKRCDKYLSLTLQ